MWISAHWECPSTGILSVRQRENLGMREMLLQEHTKSHLKSSIQHVLYLGFFRSIKFFLGGKKKKTFQFWHCQSSFLLLSSVILAGRLLRAAGNCCKKKENVIKKPLAEQSNFLHNQFLLKIDFKRKKKHLSSGPSDKPHVIAFCCCSTDQLSALHIQGKYFASEGYKEAEGETLVLFQH